MVIKGEIVLLVKSAPMDNAITIDQAGKHI